MGTYKEGTKKIIASVQDDEIQLRKTTALEDEKEVTRLILDLMGEDYILPNKRELTENALRRDEEQGKLSATYKKVLAERTGKNVTMISHICNEEKDHRASRDMILCALLLRFRVPSAQEASHILLQMQRGELYLQTYDRDTNCRNLLLQRCLDYANQGNPCPVKDWLVFTNSVILWFNKQLFLRMDRLEAGEPDFTFVESSMQLLQDWAQQLEKVGFCYLSAYRKELLKLYMEKHQDLQTETKAKEQIAKDADYEASYGKAVFNNNPKPCGRQVLIRFAIAMGCNLDETNLLLRQAQWPALYPNSALSQAEDLYCIKSLDPVGLGTIERKER